jgi:3-hydroxybutyryl-CoA dehydrogenase
MGAGIAQVAAAGGHTVKLVDKRPQAAANAIDGIRVQLEKLVTRGKLRQESAAAMAGRLIAVQDLCELADCGLVIEAIVEDLHAKQSLYRSLEEVVAPGCIFGTNTSSISVTAIGAALQRPERLAGMHFFNPAPVMALVEIVSGLATDRSVADTLFATAAAWTKTPVHTRSTPGFIVNRVARPYYGEALRLLGERATDCATIDAVMREAGGFRMGPFELMDMIGHDVNFAVTCSVWGAFFNDPRFLPSLIQQELVNAGFLGKKTGRGFFDYREGTLKPTPNTQPQQQRPQAVAVCGDCSVAQALAERLTKAHVRFDRMPYVDGRVAQADDAVIFVTDGRTATQRACDSGINNCVLIDLALDYRTNTRLALTAALQCAPAAAQSATGLMQACGITVSHIADVPGLVVMRTVAMLANEAADAVNQGVCTATAADSAMCLGVNYPKGPLSWADHIGLRKLRDVLSNLGSSYGEDRYRISPLIQRHVYSGTQLHDTHS